MNAWQTLDQARLPDGEILSLRRCGEDFEIRVGLAQLMSSRNAVSERALAQAACAWLRPDATVLIGGLGLGFTLRTVLDALGPAACVVVAELAAAASATPCTG